MSERRLSHAKDVIGLLEAGYATHVPIAFSNISVNGADGTQFINVKGRNLASVFKTQTNFSINFTGYVPLITVYQTEIEANNTAQLLMIIQGQSIPVSMVVATINTSKRDDIDVRDLIRSRSKDATLNNRDGTGNLTDVLYIASGYLSGISVVASVGQYIEIKASLDADEVVVGGSQTSIFGRGPRSKQWSYLS